MLKRLTKEIFYLSWTLAGTALVLITFNNDLLRMGIWISVAALVCHMVGVAIEHKEEREEDAPSP
jgi:hypothetical protein